jgi:hypothetical protein
MTRKNKMGRFISFISHLAFCLPSLLFLSAASPSKDNVFLAEKQNIQILTLERIRSAPHDSQRALALGESRLRDLHENYQVAGSTPPTKLGADLQQLRSEGQRLRLERTRGRIPPPDPRAAELIETRWEEYKRSFERLLEEARLGPAKESESQRFWRLTSKHREMRESLERDLVYNAPPQSGRLEQALAKDEWALLKALERGVKKTRGRPACVVAPGEHPHPAPKDLSPFYHSQGLLPNLAPLRTGAFAVPAECRTVTLWESGAKLIFRVAGGKGIAYIGSSETDIHYGYFSIPPDTPYYIENVSDTPLNLEYIALSPS